MKLKAQSMYTLSYYAAINVSNVPEVLRSLCVEGYKAAQVVSMQAG